MFVFYALEGHLTLDTRSVIQKMNTALVVIPGGMTPADEDRGKWSLQKQFSRDLNSVVYLTT
jgi:hypothetical protein